MARAWQAASVRHGEAVAVAGLLSDVFMETRRSRSAERATLSLLLTDVAAMSDIFDVALGVGVMADDEEGTVVPVVYVAGDTAWQRVDELAIQGPDGRAMGLPARVVELPRPQWFGGPGQRCSGATFNGTIGVRVTTASGARGVLTAGHVGEQVGAAISDAWGGRLGAVVACHTPGDASPQVPSLDVAVVELDTTVADGGIPHSTSLATVAPRDDLDITGATTGHSTTWVRGISPWWAGPDPQSGDWASVIVTVDGISDGGDSGGPVLATGSADPVGHVVGGVPGVYSLVQELDDQLAGCPGVDLR